MTGVERQVYSAKEASIVLGVSLSQVYAAMKTGDIPSIKIGNRSNIPKAWVEKKLRAGAEQG